MVLMVAEKPSIAASIATVLSGGSHSTRRKRIDVHEFPGQFRVSLPLMCTHTNTQYVHTCVAYCSSMLSCFALPCLVLPFLYLAAPPTHHSGSSCAVSSHSGHWSRLFHRLSTRVQQLGCCGPKGPILCVRVEMYTHTHTHTLTELNQVTELNQGTAHTRPQLCAPSLPGTVV